ncbi:hypothetical protein O3G_MSEX002329 [Manduca sexta]|uniref:Uncharacterized protein n=1 Tax=Manduca sexta TaxID=7130 RepID=A0A921YN29_MANSE|nr:hypothetical protein O3G_MSEX002329 [Manduca sexta]KAG6442342.1 hypothetical protein O3G_MSEX002329 [Manduca sexta]KAG6442343.1 hypothetical protein O3G_MSEX002329 [Manduca sexta]
MGRLRKCCCCASTRTGSLITAVLGIILSIATIIVIWTVKSHRIVFSTFIFDEEFDKKLSDLDIPRIILTINLVFTFLICTLLIIAVQKRRSWLMLPWVVLGIVLAIGLLISILHTSITYYLDKEDHVVLATIVLIGGLIYLGKDAVEKGNGNRVNQVLSGFHLK